MSQKGGGAVDDGNCKGVHVADWNDGGGGVQIGSMNPLSGSGGLLFGQCVLIFYPPPHPLF